MTIETFNPYKKPHKYKAVQTEYDGVKYPSKAEAAHAILLDALLKDNEINWWLRQVPVRLGPDTVFRVDFLVAGHPATMETLEVWAEDVKGVETPAFRKIRKLWMKYGPFPLHIIKGKKTEIITPAPKEDEC